MVEDEFKNDVENDAPDEYTANHRAYVTGAVISSVAFLESSINELYLEAEDQNKQHLAGLGESEMKRLAVLWPELESMPILKKYQMALLLTEQNGFDPGGSTFQDASGAIFLRNELVHYKPEWDSELNKHKKVEDRLNGKFALNPLSTKQHLWFPHQCLGSGCALWCISSVTKFMSEFCNRMGIPDRV